MIISETITGNRIYLRVLDANDASHEYAAWLNDPVVNRYLETRQAALEDIQKYITSHRKSDNSLLLGIFLNDDSRHIGNIKLDPIDWKDKKAVLGIMIGNKDYWGRGIGTEVVKLLVHYAFAEINLLEISLGVISEHHAAVRVYEKAGFSKGSLEKEALDHDGIKFDKQHMYIRKVRLALGTVQFGLDYGINNPIGRISKEECFAVLDSAAKNNIVILDTAPLYGESEKIIGEYLQNREGSSFRIITKLIPGQDMTHSCSALGKNRIYGCLVHHFEEYKSNPDMWGTLEGYRKEGIVEKIGFSVYYPAEAEQLIADKIEFDMIQLPYSIFDQRFQHVIQRLRELKKTVFCRSVFLQGLFFMDESELPDRLKKIAPKISKLRKYSADSGIPIEGICLNFALANKLIDYAVIGVDSKVNLEGNLKALEYTDAYNEIHEELKNLAETDENIILPINWKQK